MASRTGGRKAGGARSAPRKRSTSAQAKPPARKKPARPKAAKARRPRAAEALLPDLEEAAEAAEVPELRVLDGAEPPAPPSPRARRTARAHHDAALEEASRGADVPEPRAPGGAEDRSPSASPHPTQGDEGARAASAESRRGGTARAPELDVDAIKRRVAELEQRLAAAASAAAARLSELSRREAAGGALDELRKAAAGLVPAVRQRLAGAEALLPLLLGGGPTDAHGHDPAFEERAAPVLDTLYGMWWRVAVRGASHVPAAGPVVVVANHGGALPWDALVLRMAFARELAPPRDLRPLLDGEALAAPLVGKLAARLGAVPASPENALRLLEAGGAVGVFPEGSRNALRPWAQRYRVERFGRGGFVKLALRTRAAIVPCAIVGSEETAAPFSRVGWLSEHLDLPLFLDSALPLGALGAVPLPARWTLRFGPPVDVGGLGPEAAEDAQQVAALTDATRSVLQLMLDEEVAARASVFA